MEVEPLGGEACLPHTQAAARDCVSAEERACRMALMATPQIGPRTYAKLLEQHGSARAAWERGPGAWHPALRVSPPQLAEVIQWWRSADPMRMLAAAQAQGWQVTVLEDRLYPELLKEIPDPPPVLYIWGQVLASDRWALAVVGTRKPSLRGRVRTRQVVQALAGTGWTIVSGMARGIDRLAHEAALEVGGRTLAVLGSGLDQVYPPENRPLAERIAQRGAVISEFPAGTPPLPQHFPRRNRVISGLSWASLIMEAGGKSGALITAHYSLDYNRSVLAFPGPPEDPAYAGNLALLRRQEAALVRDVADVLEELEHSPGLPSLPLFAPGSSQGSGSSSDAGNEAALDHGPSPWTGLQPAGRAAADPVMRAMEAGAGTVDEICARLGRPAAEVQARLALMELAGVVERQYGRYVLAGKEHRPAVRNTGREHGLDKAGEGRGQGSGGLQRLERPL